MERLDGRKRHVGELLARIGGLLWPACRGMGSGGRGRCLEEAVGGRFRLFGLRSSDVYKPKIRLTTT